MCVCVRSTGYQRPHLSCTGVSANMDVRHGGVGRLLKSEMSPAKGRYAASVL